VKLATLWHRGEARLAAPGKGAFVDLNRAYAAMLRQTGASDPVRQASYELPSSLVSLIGLGDAGLAAARRAADYALGLDSDVADDGLFIGEGAAFCPVIPDAPRFLCVGRNYLKHAEEAGKTKNDVPILFVRFPSSLIGHRQPMIRPQASVCLDWEVELAFVIGRHCRHVKRADAMDVVAGYSVFNDGSVRDFQSRGVQWTAGKNFYQTGPFGPFYTTRDEIADPHDLQLTTHVNGIEVQNSNTAHMIYNIGELIEHITTWTPLQPGDVVVTGTPEGVGMARNPPWYLKAGDTVRVEVEKLGVLENPVVDEVPAADQRAAA
jgi:2-keto-4-pentenoate hydratase/2-oxohepta-3-ene-1,7-dioic acid hydratase in catechol pathway